MPRLRNSLICLGILAAGAAVGLSLLQDWRWPVSPLRPDGQAERPARPAPRVILPRPGKRAIERQLVLGTIHVYPVRLETGEFLELIVQQKGADLQVSILDPKGNPLFTVDSPNGPNGTERAVLVAKESAPYRLEVSGRGQGQAGRYEISIVKQRRATMWDRKEAAAEELYHQVKENRQTGDVRFVEGKLLNANRLWEELGNPGRQADTLCLLGNLYADQLDWRKSLHARLRARALFHKLRRFVDGAGLANDIGYVHQEISDLEAARRSYEEALILGRRYGNPYATAAALYNLGNLARRQQRSAEALESLEQARAAWRRLRSPEEVKALTAIGVVFSDAGRIDLAIERFREALSLPMADLRQKAIALTQIGSAQLQLREPEQALRFYLEALHIQQQIGDRKNLPVSLNGIGLCLLNQKRYQDALDPLQKALRLYEQKGKLLEQARVLTNLGWVLAGLDRDEDARRVYEQALSLARGRDGWTEAGARLGLSRLEEDLGNPIAAQSQAEAAVKSVETLRSALSPELRTWFLSGRQNLYGALIAVLLWRHELNPSVGYDIRALEVNEQSRSRGLLDSLSREDGSASPPPLLPLADIQHSVLDPETLLLEYHLGRKASYLWIVDPVSCHLIRLPPREEIENLAVAARRSLIETVGRENLGEARRAAVALSRALLGSAARWLGRKRLLISVPEALQDLPFAALPDPSVLDHVGSKEWPKPLIFEHEIVKIPSASVLAALHARAASRIPPPNLLAVLADPVFGPQDARLSGVLAAALEVRSESYPLLGSLFGRFDRLAYTRKEAEEILTEAGRQGVFTAFDFNASREVVLSGWLRNYRNLHFATHGLLRTDDADLSALVLSQVDRQGRPRNGFLRASDIRDLVLPADLVVLSACETGLGKSIAGEGLVGLPQAFFAAGATRVLVSLWPVNDLATAKLMKRFYHEYLVHGLSPSAALREAQKAMWRDPNRNAPFYWGGFELQGDWRPVESPH